MMRRGREHDLRRAITAYIAKVAKYPIGFIAAANRVDIRAANDDVRAADGRDGVLPANRVDSGGQDCVCVDSPVQPYDDGGISNQDVVGIVVAGMQRVGCGSADYRVASVFALQIIRPTTANMGRCGSEQLASGSRNDAMVAHKKVTADATFEGVAGVRT